MPNDKITNISPTSRVLLASTVILIVGFGMYNWTVSPQTSYLNAARLYENMVANAGDKTTMIKGQMETKAGLIMTLEHEIAETEGSFFTSASANEFFSDLEPISLQCDCSIDSLNFMSAEPVVVEGKEKGSSSVSFRRASISLVGRYENIIKFFMKLSSYSQRISVNELFIESTGYKTNELVCHITITIYLIEDEGENKETITDE